MRVLFILLLLSGCSSQLEQRCENGLLYERYSSEGPYQASMRYGEQIKCVN
jgi:hypothetical protein